MPDSRDNTVSVRIFEDTQDALIEEQRRLKKLSGKKPSFAELVAASWELYSGKSPQETPKASAGVDPAHAIDVSVLSPDKIQRVEQFVSLLRVPESQMDPREIRFHRIVTELLEEISEQRKSAKKVKRVS